MRLLRNKSCVPIPGRAGRLAEVLKKGAEMGGLASYARIHHLNGKITIQINVCVLEACLASSVNYICQVLTEFSSCKEKLLSVPAGSGSWLVCVYGDVLIELSGVRLVSALPSSCAALHLSCKTP